LDLSKEPLLDGKARRTLMDYLSTTVSGPNVEVTEEQVQAARFDKMDHPVWLGNVLGAQGLLEVCKPYCQVLAPCVFTKSRWTRRKLEIEELNQLWDLPVEWKSRFKGFSKLPFLGSAPAKILWAVASRWRAFGLEQARQVNPRVVGNGYGWVDQDVVSGQAKVDEKAAKHDDAEADVSLWNNYALKGTSLTGSGSEAMNWALDFLRSRMLLWWFRRLQRSFSGYLRRTYGASWWASKDAGYHTDREKGVEALRRCWKCTWWDWADGSSLLFWRWNSSFMKEVRDGMKIWRLKALPKNREKQQIVKDNSLLEKIKEKILKVLLRRYILTGLVESLTNFFAVLKAGNDIRMVYDATLSGLNDAVWAPSFGMPTVHSALDQVSSRTHMGDADMGEFFLNFNLDVTLQPYVGLDLFGLDLDQKSWVHWCRMLMGFKPSPYVATRQ
jgi:hypothetical protein